jgi:beta-1,4-mannosyl-glycoprotein beta-1,4-N-acetylglucosaminyltransferase
MDILEIRLNALAPYVDMFVLCESPYTHSTKGEGKRLYFAENKERFKDFPIVHLIVRDHLDHMHSYYEPYFYQVRYMANALYGLKPDDLVMVSDFDEIPDMSTYKMGDEGGFRHKEYFFYANAYTGKSDWGGTTIRKKKNIRSLSHMRRRRESAPQVGTGWHFTYCFSPEGIIQKMHYFCHQNENTEETRQRVAECRKNLTDPFQRGIYREPFSVEDPSGPQYLLDNKEKYGHLFL